MEVPDILTWIGASIIFSSILFIAYREAINKNSLLKLKVDKLASNYYEIWLTRNWSQARHFEAFKKFLKFKINWIYRI